MRDIKGVDLDRRGGRGNEKSRGIYYVRKKKSNFKKIEKIMPQSKQKPWRAF